MLFKKKRKEKEGQGDVAVAKSDIEPSATEPDIEESIAEPGIESSGVEPSAEVNTEDSKKAKKSKQKDKEQRKEKKEKAPEVPRNLYLLVEKDIPGMEGYFRGHGAPLKSIRSSVEDMKIDLLIETEPCRLIIAEAGLGRFTSTAMRAELVDLVGMCDGESKKLTIFFTNSVIKTDTHRKGFGKQGNKIDWQPYTTTLNIISYLKSLGEEYIENTEDNRDNETGAVEQRIAKILGFTGETVKIKVPTIEEPEEQEITVIAQEIAQHMDEDGLPTYKVAY